MRTQKIIFFLLLFLLPTQLTYHIWPAWSFVSGVRVDYLAPSVYLTDILVLVLLLQWIITEYKRIRALFYKYRYHLFFFSIFVLLNIYFSQNYPATLFKWAKYIEVVLLGLWVSMNRKYITYISAPLSFGIIYTFILCVFQMYLQRSTGGYFYLLGERSFSVYTPGIARFLYSGHYYLRPYATFAHPNSMAGYSLLAFFLLRLLPSHKLSTIAQVLCVLIVLFSVSQLVWLSFTILIILQFLPSVLTKGSLYVVPSLLVVSLMLSISGIYFYNTVYQMPPEISERIFGATTAAQAVSISPILGIGANAFISSIPDLQRAMYVKGYLMPWVLQPVHNIYLLIFAEFGVVGLLITIWFLFLVLNKVRQHRLKLAMLFSVLLTGMADHYWLTLQQNLLFLAIVFGILMSQRGTILHNE